jgi:YHS domain-containing protein
MRMRIMLFVTAAAAALSACSQKPADQPAAPDVASAPAAVADAPVAAAEKTAPSAEPASIGNARVFVDADGVAISGYDPVSYFKGSPSIGDAAITSVRNGATYRFASLENKAAFDADPAAYEPQYGGYCAYGAAKGAKFATRPETGAVVNGKLYFNKDASVQKLWNKDQASLIIEADQTWPSIIDKDPAA